MKTTSRPSSRTPLNATVNEYQSSPARSSSCATRPAPAPTRKASSSSCSSLYPLERRIALRSHCSPNASNSAPTTRRSVSIGIEPSAGPSAATRMPGRFRAAPAPISVERHPRTTPTPSTIVSASTISTALARNAPATTRIVPVLTRPMVGLGVRPAEVDRRARRPHARRSPRAARARPSGRASR